MNVVIGVETMGVGVIMTSTLVVASDTLSMVGVFVPRQTSTPVTVPSIGQSSLSAVPADNTLHEREVSHV